MDLSSLDVGDNDRLTGLFAPISLHNRDDWRIVRISLMDRAATSLTIARQIQSVMHNSLSACTIQSRLQQSRMSARHRLLRLPLPGNHRRLRRRWCKER
ncbi:transposable element Tcb1 transposase [Trichonephila clavipes]|nr:transposable element Tcb1 transposase [Trichonephila clavipes]